MKRYLLILMFLAWPVAAAHPPSQLGLVIDVLSVQPDETDDRVLYIDLQVVNESGLAKTLRAVNLVRPAGEVYWTRGKLEARARFARVDAGEAWTLSNRFNPLRIELAPNVELDPGTPIELELDFGRDETADVAFTQEGVNGIDWSDAANWIEIPVE